MLKKSDIAIMALATGLIVANLYYCQPLIVLIAQDFDIPASMAGRTIYQTQAGYALGLFLLVPLGDKFERKKQILFTTLLSAFFLIVAALSTNFLLLQIACVGIGFSSIVPQLILPMAANLSSPDQRGKTVGLVMSGLLVGILLSRTLSGFIGEIWGWRAMFWIASMICLALLLLIYWRFPTSKANFSGSYNQLFRSLWHFTKTEPELREASAINFLVFAIFGSFWASMVLFLSKEPYLFRADQIGMFGLVGATGALMAPLVGKLSDTSAPRKVVFYGLLILIFSQLLFVSFGTYLIPFILGIIILEIGQQAVHVSNQTRIYALNPEARNRLNTVFMTASFIGTACGSALGLYFYSQSGWTGVCVGSIVFGIAAVVVYFATASNTRRNKQDV